MVGAEYGKYVSRQLSFKFQRSYTQFKYIKILFLATYVTALVKKCVRGLYDKNLA